MGRLAGLHCLEAEQGHEAIARLLCGAGADKDLPEADGATPKCIAAHYGHEAIVQLLYSAGAM